MKKLELLTNIDRLLILICHEFHRYAKVNNKHIKDFNKNTESLYLKNWDVNNLYGWEVSQKSAINGCEWVEDISEFNEDFKKTYNEGSDEGYFLEVNVPYLEKLHDYHKDLPFFWKNQNWKAWEPY